MTLTAESREAPGTISSSENDAVPARTAVADASTIAARECPERDTERGTCLVLLTASAWRKTRGTDGAAATTGGCCRALKMIVAATFAMRAWERAFRAWIGVAALTVPPGCSR